MRNVRLQLTASIVIAVVSAGSAHAYSNDAIRDAKEILRSTMARFAAGEVLRPNVALARYNLLEMQSKAGKLSAASFCKSAKPELKLVADAFEPPEGKADDKKKWQAAIAAMDRNQASCRDASAMADQLLFGASPADYSDAALNEARAFAVATVQRGDMGEVTPVDVAGAQYAVIEIEHGAKKIPQAAFCQTGVPMLSAIDVGVEEEARIGQRELKEVIAAKQRLDAATAQCGGQLHGDVKKVNADVRSAESLLVKKDFDGALKGFNEVLQSAPQNLAALRGRGQAYAGKDDKKNAEADYTAVLKLDATDADTLMARGDLRYENNDADGALADYTGLLALDPGNIQARVDRAQVLRNKNDMAGAIADYSYVIDHPPPKDPMAQFKLVTLRYALSQRALAHENKQEPDAAIADFTKSLAIIEDADTLSGRARVYFNKTDYEHAIADYARAIVYNPKDAEAYCGLGLAKRAKGDAPGGDTDIARGKELKPDIGDWCK
jgi:tetratricopeptide (TPR) repeat protein